jgi:hypothetical protein
MIQTTAGQIERALKTLSFESNIAYVDFESGVLQSKSRSGFADLDRFTISIAESTELQKTISWFSQKENY